MANAMEPVANIQELFTVRRVFGEPIERGDVTLLPVASIRGGGGGGTGEQKPAAGGGEEGGAVAGRAGEKGAKKQVAAGSGSGAGFGIAAKPAGVFEIRGGHVRYRPAVDVNRIVMGMQIVAAIMLMTVGSIARARLRAGVRLA